jgi:hypothetical protein
MGAIMLNASIFNRRIGGFIMRRHSLPVGIFAIACALLANAAPAGAAASQTWVSGTGTDAGTTCPITAPCRTFQFAHNQTNSGGTIYVLSSGIFGPLTITKSITIVADGVEAGIHTSAGGAAITVTGGGLIVFLRGLTIDVSASSNGISFVAGAALHVHNSVIRRAAKGISFASGGSSELYVTDSVIANTNGIGIEVKPTGSGNAKVALDRVRVENTSSTGISFSGTTTTGSIAATVRDSVSAGNTGAGIFAQESGDGTTTVMVDRSASLNNNTGIFASLTGATIKIGDSTVSGNVLGLTLGTGGVIASYGNNKVSNDNDGVTPTPVMMK